MSTSNNTSRKTKAASAGVDNLTAGAYTPNMEQSHAASTPRWETKTIIAYVQNYSDDVDLLDAVDAEVEASSYHLPNGPIDVKLLGCTQFKNTETGKQFLQLTIRSESLNINQTVSLFPGDKFTDYQGKVVSAGHNWRAFADEVKRQYNEAGIGVAPGMSFTTILKELCTKGFRTWLLWDGKYTNMYVTERKYQNAVDRLARERKTGK